MDSPRGLVYDGQTLYVMHPPTLTAYQDTDGDGVADRSRPLVTGLGFDLDFRGADGRRLRYRGGAVARVRPGGSELERYATGSAIATTSPWIPC